MKPRPLYPWATWLIWTVALPLAALAGGAAVVATTDAQDLLFDRPSLWWLGALGPLAGGVFLYGLMRRRRALDRFASAKLAPLLARRVSPGRQSLRAGLLVLVVLLMVAGLIGPRWGVYLEKQKVRGADIVVALDVSRSMTASDVLPNRLELAKEKIREQLTERAIFSGVHRMALVAFAGSTSLRLPLSTDHLAFRNKLEAIRVGSAPRGGTSIAAAIQKGTDLLSRSPQEATKMILVFSDGEDHEGGAADAAREAWNERGIRVYTIGVGDPALTVGAQVLGPDGGDRPLVHDGQIVFSKLDVGGLQQIAEAGNGRSIVIGDLSQLVDAVGRMRKSDLTTEERMRHKPQYQWFVAVAILLLMLEPVIREDRKMEKDAAIRVWQQEAAA